MNMKKLVLAVAMVSGLGMGAVHAGTDQGHGKITFKGSVIDAACSIDAGSLDQTVQMGAISKTALTAGGKSTPVPFNIQLHDCDTTSVQNGVTVTFNGTAGDQAQSLDKSFATTGQAAGTVGVTVTDLGGTVIAPGSAAPVQALNDGDNELLFQAYVQGASASAVVPGTFASVANFVMAYN